MKKINVIQFLPYFPPHKGGLETHAEQWGKWWVKKDFGKISNIITSFEQEIPLSISPHGREVEQIIFEGNIIGYKKDGVENLIVPSFEVISNFPIYKIWTKEYRLILKYLEEKISPQPSPQGEGVEQFIVITRTRFFITSLVGGIYARGPHPNPLLNKERGKNIKWCHIEHGSDYVKLNSNFKNIVAKVYDKLIGNWIFRKADLVVGVSNACIKFIRDEFVERDLKVVYRGVDLINLENKKGGDLKLVFIGRLVKLKGVEDLLSAFAKLKSNISLDIIGDGEELKNLKEIVRKNNLENVNFLGFKDKEFITNYLSKNKCIFVNTSYQEGLPTSVIESLFYDNVAVASNVGGTSEISKEDDLILFEAGDVDGLVKKIEFAVEKYDSLVGKSKDIIENSFDWNKNIEKYYKLFNDEK